MPISDTYKNSRRFFLTTAASAVGATMLPACSDSTHEGTSPLDATSEPSSRALFNLKGPAPLNAANLCPAFAAVLEKQRVYTQRLSADVGFINRRDFIATEVESSRSACAEMLGVSDTQSIAFVRNTSEANACVINGLNLQPDDEVLLWEENHGSNYRSWHYRHQLKPFQVRRLTLPSDPQNNAEIVNSFLSKVSAKTKVVSFSHISNISGLRLPASNICKAIHAINPDIFIHIDGAQSWGNIAVDLDEIGCDSYSSSAHKWLCGPRGVGILMIKEKWAAQMNPSIISYDFNYNYPLEQLPDYASRFEQLGQRDTAAIGALGEAVKIHKEIGLAAVEAKIASLTSYAIKAAAEIGIETITPSNAAFRQGVVILKVGGKHKSYGAFLALHNAGIASAFVHANTVHCGPTGVVETGSQPQYLRLCPHIYNSEKDIDIAMAHVARIVESNIEIGREVIRYL